MKYIAALLSAYALSLPAQAALQVYEFTASVTGLGDVRALQWVQSIRGKQEGTVISVGDRIVGRFNYDNTAKAVDYVDNWLPHRDATTYYYTPETSPTNFFTFTVLKSGQTVRVGDANTPTSGMAFEDANPNDAGVTDVLSMNGGGLDGDLVSLNFSGLSANWVSNGGIPAHLSLSDMASANIQHDYGNFSDGRIFLRANITSLNEVLITPVPEPGTWAMLLAGLGILGFSARRKRA
ncbi:PEPxxWA-CTERM sorting domain-containing protein [Massilia rubra]|uniref:PEPxxWA-CTERM sorting domain-containing protein n=1 Tax=Massilia rubra TaxID=2607910 RepID=UPI001E3BABA6|nr:PEPxxWA-CTERM sorting domain-containing protein [Massilia rubra]